MPRDAARRAVRIFMQMRTSPAFRTEVLQALEEKQRELEQQLRGMEDGEALLTELLRREESRAEGR